MDERGQSTVEVALALPAVVFLVWWAVGVPSSGLRSLAARVAVFAAARRAGCEDRVEDGEVRTWVTQRLGRLAGGGAPSSVEARIEPGWVVVSASQEWAPLGASVGAKLRWPRERE